MKVVPFALKPLGLGNVPITYSNRGGKTVFEIDVGKWTVWTQMARWSLERLGLGFPIEVVKNGDKTLLQFETPAELFGLCHGDENQDSYADSIKETADAIQETVDTINENHVFIQETENAIQETVDTIRETHDAILIAEDANKKTYDAIYENLLTTLNYRIYL